jgi:hypothetical protein
MRSSALSDPAALKDHVLRIMDENRTMTIATLRPDGWPQATVVGFVHDDLALYFAVSRKSQKIENIRRDPRTSIAMGHPIDPGSSVRGLSIAARAAEVTDWREIDRLNGLIRARYPEVAVFAPRDANAAVVRALPLFVSLVDDAGGFRQPVLLQVSEHSELSPVEGGPSR